MSRSPTSSRRSSHESFLAHRGHDGRHRSPSPTEFFQNQHSVQQHLWKRELELNEFIHGGIMKFLDKQAVRDLIHAYDNEEIFVHGEQHFFENVFDDEDEDGQYLSGKILKNEKFNQQSNKFFKLMDQFNSSKEIDNSQPQKRARSQSWTWFLSSVFVQLFKIRNKVHERRDSHILDEMLEKQRIKNQKNPLPV